MVQIIGQGRVKPPSASQQLGMGVSRAAQGVSEHLLSEHFRNQENEAAKKLGIDISGYRDPDLRRDLIREAEQYKTKFNRAKDLAEVLKTPTQTTARQREDLEEEESRFTSKLPSLDKGKERYRQEEPENKFFPDNIGSQESPGNFPQAETSGIKTPLLDPNQKIQRSKELLNQYLQSGIPISPSDAMQLVDQEEQQKEKHNAQVDADIAQRVQAQNTYGEKAEQKLLKLYPESTDEQRAYFKKIGEEAAKQGKSEADIDRYLAGEARKFKNTLANVKESMPPARLFNQIKFNVLGTNRAWEKTKLDTRIKLGPLLREGLYGTARDVLSQIGYHPEEREAIITDLGETPKKIVSQLPQIEKKKPRVKFGTGFAGIPVDIGEDKSYYLPEDERAVQDSLSSILSSDPSTNLILLRKAYEEKGADWQLFKDSLNSLIESGQFKPNDDQFEMLNALDTPPLNNLDKILKGLNLIGR